MMNRLFPKCLRVAKRYPRITSFSRPFSVSVPHRANTLMETSGFSDTQLQVREAIAKICSNFPDEYWAAHDESGEYPHELHAALAKDGWIGIALPEDLGGSGLGISEATMMLHTISE
jgi:acyl-CoA dehydrogenase